MARVPNFGPNVALRRELASRQCQKKDMQIAWNNTRAVVIKNFSSLGMKYDQSYKALVISKMIAVFKNESLKTTGPPAPTTRLNAQSEFRLAKRSINAVTSVYSYWMKTTLGTAGSCVYPPAPLWGWGQFLHSVKTRLRRRSGRHTHWSQRHNAEGKWLNAVKTLHP